MALQDGIDVHAFVCAGLFSETYTSTGANLNSLFVSLGMLEEAPDISFNIIPLAMYLFRRLRE